MKGLQSEQKHFQDHRNFKVVLIRLFLSINLIASLNQGSDRQRTAFVSMPGEESRFCYTDGTVSMRFN